METRMKPKWSLCFRVFLMILGGGRIKIPRNRDLVELYANWQMDCYLTLNCVCAGHMSHIVKYWLLHHAKWRWWIESFPDRSGQSRFHPYRAWAQCRFKLVLCSPLLTRDSPTTTYPQENRCWCYPTGEKQTHFPRGIVSGCWAVPAFTCLLKSCPTEWIVESKGETLAEQGTLGKLSSCL